MKVVWSAGARREARVAKAWVSADWAGHVRRTLRLLERHPFMGRMVPEHATHEIREVVVETVRLWYRVHDGRVEIFRVWDARRGPVDPESIGESVCRYASSESAWCGVW